MVAELETVKMRNSCRQVKVAFRQGKMMTRFHQGKIQALRHQGKALIGFQKYNSLQIFFHAI